MYDADDHPMVYLLVNQKIARSLRVYFHDPDIMDTAEEVDKFVENGDNSYTIHSYNPNLMYPKREYIYSRADVEHRMDLEEKDGRWLIQYKNAFNEGLYDDPTGDDSIMIDLINMFAARGERVMLDVDRHEDGKVSFSMHTGLIRSVDVDATHFIFAYHSGAVDRSFVWPRNWDIEKYLKLRKKSDSWEVVNADR